MLPPPCFTVGIVRVVGFQLNIVLCAKASKWKLNIKPKIKCPHIYWVSNMAFSEQHTGFHVTKWLYTFFLSWIIFSHRTAPCYKIYPWSNITHYQIILMTDDPDSKNFTWKKKQKHGSFHLGSPRLLVFQPWQHDCIFTRDSQRVPPHYTMLSCKY